MRTSLALVVATALVAGLAGCSAGAPSAASCEPVAPGAATALVSVSGDFGEKPVVRMPTPVRTAETQTQTVITGEGVRLVDAQQAVVAYNIFNGRTGDLVGAGGWGESAPLDAVLTEQLLPGLYAALICTPVGSRVVTVISPDDGFGPAGGNAQAGIAADDSLVLVADVLAAYLPRADGALRLPESGLPLISLAPNGQPGMTTPNFPAPSTLRIATLKQGDGATVKSGDSVVLHYTGWLFDSGTVFDSSWDRQAPLTVVAGQGQTIPGFEKAIEGAEVGSQILAIIPPADGYGDAGTSGIPGGATLVFVIDVLGIVA